MAIHAQQLSRRYGKHWALRGLTFDVPQGGSVFLRGPNGAGKTTLLKILATSLMPTSGTLRLFDCDATAHRNTIRHHIVLLTHHTHLYPTLTALEHLQLLADYGVPMSIDDQRFALERVKLPSHRPVYEFSAGMKRRLGLARLLLQKPKLVLLDEPFGQLDVEGVALQTQVIQELRANNVTLIMSTHDHHRGEALCDRTLWLEHGTLHEAQP